MLKFIMVTDDSLNSGPLKKARYQVAALNDGGIPTELIIITQERLKKEESASIQFFYYERLTSPSVWARLNRAKRIRRIISDIITSSNTHDIVYYRAFGSLLLLYIPLPFFRLFRTCKIFSEHNSIEYRESLLYRHYLSVIKDFVTGNFIIGQSDGIIGVTEEITRYWTRRLFYRKIPAITIPNGFKVDSVPVRKPPVYNPGELQILFVGNVSRWHGLDRFMRGLADYTGPVHVKVHVIGDGDELVNLRQLADSLNIARSIHFHGFLAGSDLDAVFDQYHLAIGSLGIHRNGMKEASALKVREYCSRGIPFIISNIDPDFPDTFDYCLRLNADETPIKIETVLSFYDSVYAKPDHSGMMREYAQKNLDWSQKMMKLKRFITDTF